MIGDDLRFLENTEGACWVLKHSFFDFGQNADRLWGCLGGWVGPGQRPRKILRPFVWEWVKFWAWVGQNTDPLPRGGVVDGWAGRPVSKSLIGQGGRVPNRYNLKRPTTLWASLMVLSAFIKGVVRGGPLSMTHFGLFDSIPPPPFMPCLPNK